MWAIQLGGPTVAQLLKTGGDRGVTLCNGTQLTPRTFTTRHRSVYSAATSGRGSGPRSRRFKGVRLSSLAKGLYAAEGRTIRATDEQTLRPATNSSIGSRP